MKCALAVLLTLGAAGHAAAYSVLTHESVIDSVWKDHIQPLLLDKYPNATPDELLAAHAYLYGGCLISDLGYYPFSNKFFSDLMHYVRTGDFVQIMLDEAKDVNEYAFALGTLAHYLGDQYGHSIGINPSVGMLYPHLRRKYGAIVTYAEDPAAHLKTEFAFDVTMVASGSFAPKAYHDFIGYQVSKELLERAFQRAYDLDAKGLFFNFDLALGTYRHTIGTIVPNMTKVAWETKKDEIEKLTPGITRSRFVYRLKRAEYVREFGPQYSRPGVGARFLAFLFRIVPKVGPFKALSFKPPTPQAEKDFLASVDATTKHLTAAVDQLRRGPVELANINLDTGHALQPGKYSLADKAHARLVEKLADRKFDGVDASLRANILQYFGQLQGEPPLPPDHGVDWAKLGPMVTSLRDSH